MSTAALMRALMSGDRLDLIITLIPEAADVIPRHDAYRFASALDLVALNPQPLPPKARDRVALNPQPLPPKVAGRQLAHSIVRGVAFSGRPDSMFEILDDWCGTGWPRHWPWPWPWPVNPEPEPHPEWAVDTLLGGMLALAEISAHYPAGSEMRDALDKGVDMLGEAAVGRLG